MNTSFPQMRDTIEAYLPVWLRNRPGANVGYRFLWALVAPLDAMIEVALQGVRAGQPGQGTSSALPFIGRTRGIIRGQADTTETYAARLRLWLDVWTEAAAQETIAKQIHEYLGNSPRVRVINRAGHWVTVHSDGEVTTDQATWDWDSVSHPARAGFWSELWIVVYPTEWAQAAAFGAGTVFGATGLGLGHQVSRPEVDAIKGIVAQWKGAHTRVRAILWTSDATKYNPGDPTTCPDGQWGSWGGVGGGARTASHRDRTSTRYWELV